MMTAGQTYVEGDCRRCGDHLQICATWSRAEVTTFLAKAVSDRLYAAWRLSLYGLRRGEVLGMRWSDVALRARALTVSRARILTRPRFGKHLHPAGCSYSA